MTAEPDTATCFFCAELGVHREVTDLEAWLAHKWGAPRLYACPEHWDMIRERGVDFDLDDDGKPAIRRPVEVRLGELNALEQATLEFEGEMVAGLPLLHMKLTGIDEQGARVVAKAVMGVGNARQTFEAGLGIVEALEAGT